MQIVVVRWTNPDAYGHTDLHCLLAGRWTRTALNTVQWQTLDAATIAQASASELVANLRSGAALAPLDLTDRLALRRVLQDVDVVD